MTGSPFPHYREYPEERARVEELLHLVHPGESTVLDTDDWQRAFTRLTGPHDFMFGPSESTMSVFLREWPDLEFIQRHFGEIEIRHWHEYEMQREQRVSIDPSGADWVGFGSADERDVRVVHEVEVRHIVDRRTRKRIKREPVR